MAFNPYYPSAYGGYPPGGFGQRMDMIPGFQPQQPIQQPTQPQQVSQQMAQGLSPSSRPVANREEANAVSADFSGAPMVFLDITHDRVYIKRWNFTTGAADFMEYAPAGWDQPKREEQRPRQAAFAPLDEFLDMQNTIEQLKTEIERLKRPAGKAVKKNDPDE